MDDLRPDALATVAARVVAWHNRHPLARRITAAQVQSVGYVALPYLAPAMAGDDANGAERKKPGAAPAPLPAQTPAADPPPAGGAETGADQGKSLRERAVERAQAQPAGGTAPVIPTARAATKAPAAETAKVAKPAPRKPAFTEDFIAPLALRRVSRWVAEHGATADRAPRDGPVREVAVDRALAGPRTELQTLYALTAMVEVRGQRVRMLLGGGGSGAVIGNRLWSTPRLAAAIALLGGVAVAAVVAYVLVPAAPAPASTAPVPLPVASVASGGAASIVSIRPPALRASAAAEMATRQAVLAASAPPALASGSAAHAPEVAAHAGLPVHATPALPATAAASAHTPAAPVPAPPSAPAPPTRPLDVEPTLGRINMPTLGLPRGDGTLAGARERRLASQAALPSVASQGPQQVAQPGAQPPQTPPPQASQAAPPVAAQPAPGARATAERPTPPPALALPATTTPAATPAAPSRASPAAAPPGSSAFALSSRLLRTRAEAEQTVSAMRSLLVSAGHPAVHVDLVPVGDDWRVVGWPFAQRTQADAARSLLATRGMRVTVIDF